MGRDKVVIIVITTVVLTAILFGIFMAYKIYLSPMYVNNIEETISILNDDTGDGRWRMNRLSIYNELSKSCKMIDRNTNELRKFTKDEMNQFYENIGGKESILTYLRNIENDDERREELEYARYQLRIITQEELNALWW